MRMINIRFPLAACAFAVLLSACGGGDATAPGSGTPGSSGFAVDGYLSGATVVCDANGNGVADSGERTVTTDSSGFFRFTSPCTSALIATGGTSIDTGLAFTGTLRAPSGATVITPLTTLIASGMSETKLKEVLGINATGSLLTTDPARKETGSNTLVDADLMKKTLVIQQLVQKSAEVIVGLATSGGEAARGAVYGEVMGALAKALAANPALVTGGTVSETVTQALVKAAVQGVAASTTLPAGVKAGVAALNADSLAQAMAGALKAQSESILGATGDALTSTTKAAQESTAVTTLIVDNRMNASLTGAPSAATTALGTQATQQATGTAPTANNLVANGNFSNGTTGWSGNALQVRTEGGNIFNFADVAVAGEPYAVNLSYVLNIPTSGVGYKLRFKASSNRARTMLAGIGLNQDPWTNVTQVVNLTTVQQTFELRLTSTFASLTSRVIFDMGAATGNVVIDDVELTLDAPPAATNLVANGNFSNGITGWSGNARDVRTEGGNSFNFADVAVAGEPFAVNLSYVVNIPTSGVAYKLRFKASSNRNRTMLAGIGLNQDPWTNVTQVVNLTTAQQTFELSLTSNFANASSRVIFDMGAATGQVVIDDVELLLDTTAAPAPAGGPTVAASAPTAASANVKSIFSDSYTNVAVDEYGPDWGAPSARITSGVIAGNNYKTMDISAGKTFAGISFASSKFNATAYTTFHMDYWIDTPIPVGQVLSIKLSNHDGAGETSAIETTVVNITGGGWQRLAIPLSTFTQAANSLSRNNIAQIIITAARADLGVPVKVHFDNMYFSQ